MTQNLNDDEEMRRLAQLAGDGDVEAADRLAALARRRAGLAPTVSGHGKAWRRSPPLERVENPCLHGVVQQWTDYCLECGRNTNESDEEFAKGLAEDLEWRERELAKPGLDADSVRRHMAKVAEIEDLLWPGRLR